MKISSRLTNRKPNKRSVEERIATEIVDTGKLDCKQKRKKVGTRNNVWENINFNQKFTSKQLVRQEKGLFEIKHCAPPRREDESKGLRGERDRIKLIDLRVERWQVVGFRKARRQDVP